jgi:hypothetical protein
MTQLPYVDELSAVDSLLADLKGELAPAVEELGLSRLVKRLEMLTADYRAALSASDPSISFGVVRAARSKGQESLLQVVAIILGEFPLSSPEHVKARSALLAPILTQNEAIRQYLRGRRGGVIEDVNPETGEPEVGAPSPAPDEAQGEGPEAQGG